MKREPRRSEYNIRKVLSKGEEDAQSINRMFYGASKRKKP
jgi:hypothetical protein